MKIGQKGKADHGSEFSNYVPMYSCHADLLREHDFRANLVFTSVCARQIYSACGI